MSRVQIEESLWWDLVDYHISGRRDPELMLRIHDGIECKLQAMERRALYTASKVSEDVEVREAARQAYLDAAGIRESFRE